MALGHRVAIRGDVAVCHSPVWSTVTCMVHWVVCQGAYPQWGQVGGSEVRILYLRGGREPCTFTFFPGAKKAVWVEEDSESGEADVEQGVRYLWSAGYSYGWDSGQLIIYRNILFRL